MEEDLDSLLAELAAEVSSSKTELSNLKQKTSDTKKQMNIKPPERKKIVTKDPILPRQPKYEFSKTSRFQEEEIKKQKQQKKEQELEQIRQKYNKKHNPQVLSEDLNSSKTSFLSATSAKDMAIKKRVQTAYIPKAPRFKQKEEIDQRDYNYDIDVVKKKNTGIKINPEPQKSELTKSKLAKQQARYKFKQNFLDQQSMVSSQMMDDLETEASICEPGPGQYQVRYDAIDTKRSAVMPKSSRFQKTKSDERSELNPKYEAIQKSLPKTVIKDKQPKTKQYLKKQQELETLQKEAVKAQKERNLDADLATRRNIGTAILKAIDTAPAGSRDKKFMIFYLLDKIRQERQNGPGQYDQEEEKPAPCQVVMRSHSNERRVPDNHQDPGPNYYYSRDDLCVENQPVFTFAKAGQDDHLKEPEEDTRLPLEINEKHTKKAIIGGYIETIPEEKPIDLQDIIDNQRGPGFYENNFKLVEKRTDLGAVEYKEITEANDRQNNMDFMKKDYYHNDEEINPNLDAIKPNIKGDVKLHEPVDQKPANPTDKELFPEKWKFYDGDLDQVREKLVKPVQLAPGGKDREQFKEHEEFMNMMKAYFDKQKKVPEGYDVNYKQIDKKEKVPNLKKNLAKDLLDPIVKPEGDVDGDNLILQPELPKKKLPDVNMKKISGRKGEDIEEIRKQNEDKEELILNPKKEKKVKGFVNFQKQTKRPTYEDEIGDKREEDTKPPLNPNTQYLEKKVKGAVNLKGQSKRPEGPKPKDEEIVMDIKQDQVKPKVKGGAKW